MAQPSSIGQVNPSQETYNTATAKSLLFKRMEASRSRAVFLFLFFFKCKQDECKIIFGNVLVLRIIWKYLLSKYCLKTLMFWETSLLSGEMSDMIFKVYVFSLKNYLWLIVESSILSYTGSIDFIYKRKGCILNLWPRRR